MNLPTREEALRMMREAGCSHPVIDHCLCVTKLAVKMADALLGRGIAADPSLVEVGALMHDLGRSKTHGVEHGAIGGQLAREMGLPEPLARVIERHVGGGITAGEAKKIGLGDEDLVPETIEEKIVAYADKLIEGNRQVDIGVTIEKFEEELGREHPALERLRALHDEMTRLIGTEL